MKDKQGMLQLGGLELGDNTVAVIKQISSCIVGFILSHSSVLGGYVPFGIAFVAGVPLQYSVTAAIGAGVGYLLPLSSLSVFRYIAAVMAIVAVRQLLPEKLKLVKRPSFSVFLAMVSSLLCALLPLAVAGTAGWLHLIECLLAGCGAYFIHRAGSCIERLGDGSHASQPEMASVVFLIGVVLTAFNPISIYGVKLSGIAAGLVVLYAARFGKEAGGAIAGISIGFVMSLADNGSIELAGAYSLGGLLAGLVAPLGAVCSILALVLSVAVFLLRSDFQSILPAVYELSAASLIFVLSYYKVGSFVGAIFSPPTEMPRLDGLRKTVSMRLGFAADALSNVNSTVKSVAERLSSINTPAYEDVFSRVEREACSNCPLCAHCWQNERADTLAALVGLTAHINKKVPTDELPNLFARTECSRAAVVCNSLERNYREYDNHRVAQQRIDEIRTVIADQFAGMSDMLNEMSAEFERSQKYDRRNAETVAAVIGSMGYRATDIACTVDSFERMTVEIRLDESVGRRINKIELMKKLSIACGRDFAPPAVSSAERKALITFCEQPALDVEYGFAQHCSTRSQMCGDTGEYFLDGRGHAVAILSDGMGTGGRAAVDSAMAAGLLRRLISAGFGYDCSLRIVNSAMLYKSTDETLATVDVASLDLFTGRLNMFKAGAAATVIRRSGRVGKAECSSLPVGILRDIGFDCAEVRLGKGDVVVLMSDGVQGDGTAWVCDMVKKLGIETAQQLAEDIADSARRRRTDGLDDDITVMVMLINEHT